MASFSSFVLLSLVSLSLAWSPLFERTPPGCLADNCLRAITGTEAGQTQTRADRIGDCSSFLLKTVTPDIVTVTSTASFISSTAESLLTTTTTTITAAQVNGKRSEITLSPTNVPAYASPCSGTVRYSSACSCAGVTGSTITVAAPTITYTVTASSITTIDIIATTTSIVVVEPSSSSSLITSTSTTASLAGPTACSESTITIDNDDTTVTFNQYFIGYGVDDTTDELDGAWLYDGSLSACDVLAQCGANAWTFFQDQSINVHYVFNSNQWLCYSYPDSFSDPLADMRGFTNYDSNVGVAMGYIWNGDSSALGDGDSVPAADAYRIK